jgi:predicted membrane protein
MKERQYRPSLVGPILLITAGVVLLLNQTGRLPWAVWGTLWRFWPIIFILVGLEVIVGVSRSRLLYVLSVFFAVAVLGAVILYAVYAGGPIARSQPTTRAEEIVQPLNDADRADVQLQFAVGNLNLGALVDSANFAEGRIEYGRNSQGVKRTAGGTGGRLSYALTAQTEPFSFWWPGEDSGESWDIDLTPRIPLDIEVRAGVGDLHLDLSQLTVPRLDVGSGVGDTTIDFPMAAGRTKAVIQGAIGDMIVRIPDGVGAKVTFSKLLASVDVRNSRFVRADDAYVTANYDTAPNRLDVEMKLVIGNIVIE